MQINIDYREVKLISLLRNTELIFHTQNLTVGDIELKLDDKVLLIERKTLDDHSSSIVDGRFNEQKSRLLQSGAIVVYIIEGHSKSSYGVPLSTLYSSIFSMQARDKIVVLRSFFL